MNRRPRPLMAPQGAEPAPPSAPARPGGSSATSEPDLASGIGEMTSPTTRGGRAAKGGSRRSWLAVPLLVATLAGAAGWWLRGSPSSQAGDFAASPGAPENASTPAAAGSAPATGPGSSAPDLVAAREPAGEPAGNAAREPAGNAAREPAGTAAREPGAGSAGPDAAAADRAADAARRARARKAAARRADRAAARPDVGYFSVDAFPYAEIYIDGISAGITPLVRIPLRPGKHTVRAVAESGATESFPISVRAGKTVSRRLRLELLRP
jgi:hypothetical protein